MSQGRPLPAHERARIDRSKRTHMPTSANMHNGSSKQNNVILFVGQLNNDVTEQDVYDLFSYYGDVRHVALLKSDKRRDKEEMQSQRTQDKKSRVIGSSAFVTYNSTDEADLAIMSLHGKYCMDDRDKPLQVSYCVKTDAISDFGYRHNLQLHASNPVNPVPHRTPQTS